MHIVHIASEFAPIAKAGGLADVVYGLSKEQLRAGHKVEVILPMYDLIHYAKLDHLLLEQPDLWSLEDNKQSHNSVFSAVVDGIEIHLISPDHADYYFSKNTIYGCMNDIERFLYFSRASYDYLKNRASPPDIIHLHDWPTSLVAPLIKLSNDNCVLKNSSIAFTIHNMEHQGKCHAAALNRVGLHGLDLRTADLMQDPFDPSLINLLKGAIVFSDVISTVSPNYAQEIQTPPMGFGLSETLLKHKNKLTGILNGIEIDSWNPAIDQTLSKNYPTNPTYLDTILEMKKKNKTILLEKLSMTPSSGPLIVCISRLVHQKGPELIQTAIHTTLEKGGSFILLGTCHDPEIERDFLHIKKHYHHHPHLFIGLIFNEELARQTFAAADAIIIPSIFEPCGLTQMISMRYGTVPIARNTGGLADTIFDINSPSTPKLKRNGFLFDCPTPNEIQHTLNRVFECFEYHYEDWKNLIRAGLNEDLSWHLPQKQYQKLYETVLKHTG